MNTTTRTYAFADSPLGRILLVAGQRGLCGLYLADHEAAPPPRPEWRADASAFPDVVRQLDEYFDGTRTEFDLDLELEGTTFQRSVWTALTTIPYGRTLTYGELARRIGQPGASRAVGLANGRNPVSIIVPCHRVVATGGGLGGYGWGTECKAWLLALESRQAQLLPQG